MIKDKQTPGRFQEPQENKKTRKRFQEPQDKKNKQT